MRGRSAAVTVLTLRFAWDLDKLNFAFECLTLRLCDLPGGCVLEWARKVEGPQFKQLILGNLA